MDIDDQRDHAEEAYNRATMEDAWIDDLSAELNPELVTRDGDTITLRLSTGAATALALILAEASDTIANAVHLPEDTVTDMQAVAAALTLGFKLVL